MDSTVEHPGPRRLKLRYPATCATCGSPLAKGTDAFWDTRARKATCLSCIGQADELVAGEAGASAAAEGERRTANKIAHARREHGERAAEVAAVLAGRDAAATWGKGSDGESRLARYIAKELGDSVLQLHDRLIPGTRGNIDHIFVAPTGVWVVDAKSYTGKVECRERGPFWQRENDVYVNGRNRTPLAAKLEKQVDAVRVALGTEPSLGKVDVWRALCFLDSEWGLLDFPFVVANAWVLYPGALKKKLKKSGGYSRESMEDIARVLAAALPRAVGDQTAASVRARPASRRNSRRA